MSYFGIFIIVLTIVMISIYFYYDYKNDSKEFNFSIKSLGKGLLYIGILAGLNGLYNLIIPFKKNHGIEFNSKRETLGIPILEKDWEVDEYQSDQFTTYWWKQEPSKGHFKKIIDYGIMSAKSETDYYKNEKLKGTFVWSKYDFVNKKFEYYLEEPNDEFFSKDEDGKFKASEPTSIKKINRTEFEKFITE